MPFILTVVAFIADLLLLPTPTLVQAQVTPKDCRKLCQLQKKTCQKNFKNQFGVAKAACGALSGSAKKDCKKAAKLSFQQNKAECITSSEGFKTCKACCEVNPVSCAVAVCGDGQQLGAEQCDEGTGNSNTTPHACRTNCTLPICGDGVLDTSEACDGAADDACPDACRGDCSCPACPANFAGGPNRLTFTVGAPSDLDTGVSGISHNQGVTVGSQTFVCLQGCDVGTNSVCTGTGQTDTAGKTDTINGPYFGAPLPLLSGGVPVCVINEYREDITLDSFDLATGELSMKVRLLSKVHQTSNLEPAPCPNCEASGAAVIGVSGRCRRGANDGQSCTIDGLTEFGPTSKDCLPDGTDNVGNLEIDLDLTTGEVVLPIDGFEGGGTCVGPPAGDGGPCPCAAQKQRNQCANENACSEAACPSGLEPGLDQLCCQGGSGVGLGCYPGQGAFVTDIIRFGAAAIAYGDPATTSGAWPDPTYPKTTAQDGALVSVFCIDATRANVVNNVAGLPGPGAIILPGPMEVALSRCAGGDNDGQPCGSQLAMECPGGTCR